MAGENCLPQEKNATKRNNIISYYQCETQMFDKHVLQMHQQDNNMNMMYK